MPSEKFRITTNGQSLRNPSNGFFGMTLSANLTLNENDLSAHNDRRSAHNALERQRREHLNMKFQQLAHALPSLQSVRRPSKTMIVSKSLEFVSASLKRESKYTSEIQKLRLENEKLKRQAEAACKHSKKSQPTTEQKQSIETSKEALLPKDKLISTAKEKKPSLKRRASSDLQLSPPPTPESMLNSKDESDIQKPTEQLIVHSPKKKKMMKQTKPHLTATTTTTTTTAATQLIPPIASQPQQQPVLQSPEENDLMSNQMSLSSLPHFNSSSTQVSMVTPLKELPWSHSSADNFHPPLNSTSHDIDIQTSTYLGLNSAPYNMVNNTPQSPSTTSSSHTSYYITSSSPNLDIYNPHSDSSSLSLQSFTSQPSQQHYPTTTNTTNMIHPMLLAPYYMSTTEVATVPHGFVYSTNMQNHERQQSDGSDFYLS